MERVIYRCWTKATDREGDRVRWSLNWGFARRGELRLTDTAIELGDWHISYDIIDDAVLLAIPTPWGNAHNLLVKSLGSIYQFQLLSKSFWRCKLDPFWTGELPFPVRREVWRRGWGGIDW